MLLSGILKETGGLSGTLLRDGPAELTELCSRVRVPNAVTFLEKEKFLPCMDNPNIGSVICPEQLAAKLPAHIGGVFVTDEPKYAFFCIHNFLAEREWQALPTEIGRGCAISPEAYIAPVNVKIGDRVTVEPGVKILEGVEIGDDCYICAGTVLGGLGFDLVRYSEKMLTLRDRGRTVLKRGVRICSNCHVARGVLKNDVTLLEEFVQLDAMVHVGHGTVVGPRTEIPAGAMLAGNCVIGSDVWIGVNATVSNRITIGDGARISLGSVVTKDVAAGETVTGNFAIPHQRFLKNLKGSISDTQVPPLPVHLERRVLGEHTPSERRRAVA